MLSVREISITYGENPVPAVADFSLEMKRGEIVSIVGESGSGKTSLVRAILGCLPGGGRVSQGEILFEGRALSGLGPEEWRNLRGTEISMIFQDSGAMLNPVRRIGSQYVEYIRTHERVSRREAWDMGKRCWNRCVFRQGNILCAAIPFSSPAASGSVAASPWP